MLSGIEWVVCANEHDRMVNLFYKWLSLMVNFNEHERRAMGFTFYWVQREWWNLILNHKKMFDLVVNGNCGLTVADLYQVGWHADDVKFKNM